MAARETKLEVGSKHEEEDWGEGTEGTEAGESWGEFEPEELVEPPEKRAEEVKEKRPHYEIGITRPHRILPVLTRLPSIPVTSYAKISEFLKGPVPCSVLTDNWQNCPRMATYTDKRSCFNECVKPAVCPKWVGSWLAKQPGPILYGGKLYSTIIYEVRVDYWLYESVPELGLSYYRTKNDTSLDRVKRTITVTPEQVKSFCDSIAEKMDEGEYSFEISVKILATEETKSTNPEFKYVHPKAVLFPVHPGGIWFGQPRSWEAQRAEPPDPEYIFNFPLSKKEKHLLFPVWKPMMYFDISVRFRPPFH